MKIKFAKYAFALMSVMALGACENFSEPPVPDPEGGKVGTGYWSDPMSAYQARIGAVNDTLSESPWVTGVIVGYVDTEVGNVLNEKSAWIPDLDTKTAAGATVYTNLLIATSREVLENVPESERWKYCASVQLPSGSVRNALSLKDHPDNLWKEVTLQGVTGQKYCGVYGVRSVSDFEWGKLGKEPVYVPPVEALGDFFENFDQYPKIDAYISQGWQNIMVKGGLSGWYIKEFSGNNYITTSAYLGNAAGGPYENWLLTPPVNVDLLTDKTLEFVTQAAYKAADSSLEVYVLDSDNIATAKSTKLNAVIAVAPESGYSAWVNSGKLDLSSFSGEIYIGWKYYSASGGNGNSTTFCIDNVNVGGATPTVN